MMRFVLIIAVIVCAAELCAYASIQQDVIERDTIGAGGGGGGDLSTTDIDTFSELDAIVADEGLVNLNDVQTLLNKTIDGDSNTIKMLRHPTDCTSYTGAVDGQYCWEQDDNVLYVCETADECDTAGEWNSIASGGSPLTVEESDGNPSVSSVSVIQFNASHFTVTDETGGQAQVDSILSPLATALASNPSDCSANQFANTIAANGNLTCAAISDADVPNNITVDLAAAATALASNPSDCSANQYATTIAANGNLTCAQVAGTQVSNTPAGNIAASTVQAAIDELDTEKLATGGNAVTASALASNPTDCSSNQFANAIAASGNLSCSAISDADVPDTITVSNYLPLAGGTLTGLLTTDNLGIEYEESDTNPTCSTGNYNTYADLSETAMKVCNNGTAEVLTTPNNTQTLTNKTLSASNNVIQADTALALDVNPSDCSANQYATTIAANGNLTCAQVSGSQVTNTPAGNVAAATAQAAIDELDTEKPDKSKIKTLFVFRPTMNEPPASNFATIDTRNSHPVLDFDGSTNESAVFTFVMPQAYSGGGVTVYIHYAMTSATSGDIDWDVAFERVGDQQQDIDSDSFASVQSVDNTVVPGTSGNVDVVSVSFTNGAQMDSCAAGEVCRIKITRDAASDTDNTDAELVAMELRES